MADKTDVDNVIHYAAFYDGQWGIEMEGAVAVDDTSDAEFAGSFGKPITKFTMGGVEKYRVFTRRHKWSKFFNKFDKENPAGDGSPILAIEVYDKNVIIGVHINGGTWLPAKHGTFEGDTSSPTYAGSMSPIDAIWIDR